MDNLSEKLAEELENHTAFTIPVFGGIPVPDSCLVSWIIIGVVVLLSIILTHNLKKVPKGKQCLLEIAVNWMNNFFLDTIGPHGKKYLPILETFLIYIGFSNIIGIFGFVPPTKDINVTVALAVMASVLIQVSGSLFSLFGTQSVWPSARVNPWIAGEHFMVAYSTPTHLAASLPHPGNAAETVVLAALPTMRVTAAPSELFRSTFLSGITTRVMTFEKTTPPA